MRILIAEDDNTTALLIRRMLKNAGHQPHRVRDGQLALDTILAEEPFDAIVTDWMMPNLDGLQLIAAVRRQVEEPPPLIVLTAVASDHARSRVLEAGADDYLAKPVRPDELVGAIERCIARGQQTLSQRDPLNSDAPSSACIHTGFPVVCIAAGTGGPMALQRIFKRLAAGDRACFIVVQHGPNWMLETFAHRLQSKTELSVRMIADGKQIKPGQILLAPGECHSVVSSTGECLRHSDIDSVNFVRPSADMLFDSAAAALGRQAIALILTGIGCDGALGAQRMRLCGASVMVQDPASAEVASMPRNCLTLTPGAQAVELDAIAERLDAWINELAGDLSPESNAAGARA